MTINRNEVTPNSIVGKGISFASLFRTAEHSNTAHGRFNETEVELLSRLRL